jgi:hypothetical protein
MYSELSPFVLLVETGTILIYAIGINIFHTLGYFLFFLCFASVENCETNLPARGKNKQASKTKLFLHVV